VVVTVHDQGAGISADDLKHIADPFFTTRQKSGGTGLGLSISQRIVRDHGGTMTFASEVGRGTTVTVSLPAVGNGTRPGE
jgi:polar amino acid transport system substrate-binding protein